MTKNVAARGTFFQTTCHEKKPLVRKNCFVARLHVGRQKRQKKTFFFGYWAYLKAGLFHTVPNSYHHLFLLVAKLWNLSRSEA